MAWRRICTRCSSPRPAPAPADQGSAVAAAASGAEDSLAADSEEAAAARFRPSTYTKRARNMGKLIQWNVLSLDGYFEGLKSWDVEWFHSFFDKDMEEFS